ncbi:related to glutathione S-transferase [Rhynchosporium secalis]|uniref:glutathione transferase n=1 Tax=Rhynchosporium secalis TaxID=38038 RepID=A0A1E1MT54_RHYSE|nr:related to glutathione S-transferase [Rhynchosporium secalis]
MTLTIHGSPYSTCCQRIFTVLAEKGVEANTRTLDFATGEHKHPDFLKLQPFGKVPVLEDDEFFIYESRAITKYIAKKYAGQGTKLMPEEGDFKAYGFFEQACSVEQSYFDGPASGICWEKVFKPMKGLGNTDEELVKKHVAALDAAFAVYDVILGRQAYLAGDELTLADLSHLPYGKMVKDQGFEGIWTKYPNVDKWFTALEKRESWVKATGGK